jgi:tetratricopeptide (TPR) repeat protein
MFNSKTNEVIQGPENPYVIGNAVGGSEAFVGRIDILQAVESTLAHPHNNAITLFGQRRIGKTSILTELKAKLPKEQYQAIYFDLMGRVRQPLETIVGDLTETICRELKLEKPQWENSVDAFCGWMGGLLNDTAFGQKSLVLLFDEFDALQDNQAEKMRDQFFSYLRDLLSLNTKRLNLVFAIGRNIDDFNAALALLKNHNTRRVSLFLPLKEAEDLILLSEKNNSLRWSKPAIKKVIAYTNGHPLLTQLLCNSIWQQLWSQKLTQIPKVTLQIVDQSSEQVFTQGQGKSALAWLWEGLPAACRVDAAAFAELGQQKISHQALITHLHESGIGMIMTELETAPRTLKEWDIIEGDAENGYRFRVEFFRQWIVRYKPLKEIMQEELGRIRVEANEYYRQGESFYRAKKFDEAADSLKAAIRINFHFIEAHQLLAKVLIEKGEVAETQTVLEKFYQCCPEAARSQLIELLWRQVESSNSRREQLTLCDQILDYDPAHANAKKTRKDILQWQGQRLEKDQKYEEALAVYRKLGLENKLRELRSKIFWQKYGKYVKRLSIFLGIFFLSILVSYLFVNLSIPWSFWGPALSLILGIIFTLLLEKIPFTTIKNKNIQRF